MIIVYLIIGYLISVCITAITFVTCVDRKGEKINDIDFTYTLAIWFPGVNTLYSVIIVLVLIFYLTFYIIKFILLCIFRGIKFLVLKIVNKIHKK